MKGYGGNLTYPENKQFRNSFGIIANPGVAPQEFRLVVDAGINPGVVAASVLFIEGSGDYIPGGAARGATVVQVDHEDSIARMIKAVLDDRGPCDECDHELGFIVKAINRKPGVMNDNLYGQLRTYSHKFKALDPLSGGYISDLDVMRAYEDISQQITDDAGRYNGHMQGNVEAIVEPTVRMEFSGTVAAGTFDIPAAGLYGVTLAAAAAYIDSPLVKAGVATVGNTVIGDNTLTMTNAFAASLYVGQELTIGVATPASQVITKIEVGAVNTVLTVSQPWTNAAGATVTVAAEPETVVNRAAGITNPGYGFIVHVPGAETLVEHSIHLVTKDEYQDETTFQLQEVDGVATIEVQGAFELMPWKDVYREFTHMGHDVPLSNHWAKEKPANVYNWSKFILKTTQSVGNMHGASHGNDYLNGLVLYVADNGATTGVAGCVADLKTLFDAWAAAV